MKLFHLTLVACLMCAAVPAMAQRRPAAERRDQPSEFENFAREAGRLFVRDVKSLAATPRSKTGNMSFALIGLNDMAKKESQTALRLRYRWTDPAELAPVVDAADPDAPKAEPEQHMVTAHIDESDFVELAKALDYMIKNQPKLVKAAETYREVSYGVRGNVTMGFFVDPQDKTVGSFIEIGDQFIEMGTLEELRDLIKTASTEARTLGK